MANEVTIGILRLNSGTAEVGFGRFSNQPVASPWPPDVCSDGIIDIVDIVIVALAFGSRPGDSNWNPIADLNQDGIIDIVDIVMIAIHFGETV